MYRVIFYDNPYKNNPIVIHEPENYGNKLLSGTVTIPLDSIFSAELSVPFNNEGYGHFSIMKHFIQILERKTDKELFYGRVSKINTSMSSSGQIANQVVCEGELAYLMDSVQIFRETNNQTIKSFLSDLIASHNNQVEDYKRFKLGNITINTGTDNIYRGISTGTTLDNIREKLISRIGGYLVLRKERDGNYIDYLKDVGELKETPLKIGKNIIDAQKEFTPEGLFTRIFPFGKEIEPQEDDKNKHQFGNPRVDISSVNNGKKYLDHQELIKLFGVIGKSVTFDEVTNPKILKTKGQNELNRQIFNSVSWTLNIVELSMIDIAYESIELGDKYMIDLPLISGEEQLQVISKTINLATPHKSNLTFGKQAVKLSEIKKNAIKTQDTIKKLKNDLDRKYSETQSIISEKTKSLPEIASRVSTIQEKTELLDKEIIQANKQVGESVQLANDTKQIADEVKTNVEAVNSTLQEELTKQKEINENLQKQIDDLKTKPKEG